MLIRGRDSGGAIQLLRRAIEVDPRYAAAYRELAWTYLKERALDEALMALEDALHLDGNDARTHLYLGHVLMERGDNAQAQAEFERARLLSPLWTLPLLLKGRLLEENGNLAEAESAFRMAVKISPSDADCLAELGRHVLISKKFAEAEQLLTEALRLQPNHKPALDGVARLRSAT